MRIGIIGGSFNPIHIAHLIIADRFVDQLDLDRCYFVPTAKSPFKIDDPMLASATERLEMVRLATEQHPMFHVSDVEVQRGGVSYTIDTVASMQAEHPGSELFILIGSDQAVEFVRWHRWQELLRAAQLCVVRRPFLLTPEMEERLTENLTVEGRSPIWINAPLLEISSTDIRLRVRQHKSINYLTTKAVRDFIGLHGLYRR
ncbi:MAG: nicotinate (nicotinamide) nucleotide adenylyltransferase [Candidatus Kapabacteria bacterium]|nr:nicotinate (nicotinamide) nucleotide adenylyltransferase [Candidatus Kapabacteria bacterium]